MKRRSGFKDQLKKVVYDALKERRDIKFDSVKLELQLPSEPSQASVEKIIIDYSNSSQELTDFLKDVIIINRNKILLDYYKFMKYLKEFRRRDQGLYEESVERNPKINTYVTVLSKALGKILLLTM